MKSIAILAFLGLVASSTIPTEKQTSESLNDNQVIIEDMIFTQEQYEVLYGKGVVGRNGIPSIYPILKWPNNKMPYVIDSSISPSEADQIRKVLSRFNSKMSDCFRIV